MNGQEQGAPVGSLTVGSGRPLSSDSAVELVRQHWGQDVTAVRLDGERDDNFRVTTADGTAWMLKVVHPHEPADVVECQTAVLAHLAATAPELPVARLVSDRYGQATAWSEPDGSAGVRRALRMTTFLSGTSAAAVPGSPVLRADIGRRLAQVDRALTSFDHPALARPVLWDIARLDRLSDMAAEIDDAVARSRLGDGISWFVEAVSPRLRAHPVQAVHNDLSNDNMLVARGGAGVSAVLDFGDLARTQRVCDLAVAAAYQLGSGTDLIGPAVEVVRGYQRQSALGDDELDLVPDLVVARMYTRLVITEWRARRFPGNARYILRNTPRTWQQLDQLLALPAEHFRHEVRTQ